MIKYCGVALCALAAILMLKGQKNDFAGLVSLAAGVILLGAAVVTFLPVFEFVENTMSQTSFSEHMTVLGKALGITLAVQLSAEICRDAGESAIASKLELVGKAEILLLALPLIGELIGLAAEIMQI
ncbi:MAG: hypothetical protein IJY93_07670 [Clostridia bacterium]|nr:hypothetical protein [Clostridia bacterium]